MKSLFTRVHATEFREIVRNNLKTAFLRMKQYQYDQLVEDATMGLLLLLLTVNTTMAAFKEDINASWLKLKHCTDMWTMFLPSCCMEQLQEFNSIHLNIKFTMEVETDYQLPFLDVLIDYYSYQSLD
jgi:hypothetical protein